MSAQGCFTGCPEVRYRAASAPMQITNQFPNVASTQQSGNGAVNMDEGLRRGGAAWVAKALMKHFATFYYLIIGYIVR